jgi:hypothetical protein
MTGALGGELIGAPGGGGIGARLTRRFTPGNRTSMLT